MRQYFDQSAGAWFLVFPKSLTVAFDTKTVNIQYQYRHPRITSIDDTVYLPEDYLSARVAMWYAAKKLTEQNTDKGAWMQITALWSEQSTASLRGNRTPALIPLPYIGPDRMPS